eukprot:TRINITY_DN74274_c0_g1_i5.p2 TRINITY_DN74274_c0_g1~~TRINITY_DN74274_c0_g1_i5.p2  ORF type:complete len:165 (+),score=3.72 TRINITY_DN74274_c0_g1_i5:42-497(+)
MWTISKKISFESNEFIRELNTLLFDNIQEDHILNGTTTGLLIVLMTTASATATAIDTHYYSTNQLKHLNFVETVFTPKFFVQGALYCNFGKNRVIYFGRFLGGNMQHNAHVPKKMEKLIMLYDKNAIGISVIFKSSLSDSFLPSIFEGFSL